MNIPKPIFYFLMLLVVLLIPPAQTTARTIRMSDALKLAITHSYQLKKAQAEQQASEAMLKAAQASRFPSLSVTSVAFYKDAVPTFDISLPTGGLSRGIGTNDNYQNDFRLSLPLYTGGKISEGINLAKASREYYQALKEGAVDKLCLQVSITYLALMQADRQVEAARASLHRVQTMQDDVHSLYNAGAADSIDVLEVARVLSEAKFGVKRAISQRRTVEIQLLTMLGLKAEDTLILTDTLPAPQKVTQAPLSPAKPELLAAKAGITLAQSRAKQKRADFFPTVSAYAGYSYGKPNIDFFNNDWNDYWSVGGKLTWSFNIGGKTTYEVRKAKYDIQASQRIYDNINETLHREKYLAWEGLQLSYERYTTAVTIHTLAANHYQLAQQQYHQGTVSSNRLVEIETALTEAESQLAAALADYYIALRKYYFATGSELLRKGW